MRVLLIHRHYYPDSPTYAHILAYIRSVLLQNGIEVDVLTAQPSYRKRDKNRRLPWKEHSDNGIIYRLPIFRLPSKKIEKVLNSLLFPCLSFMFQITSKHYDVVLVATTPPVINSFVTALVSRFRKRHMIYHMMDIHPEVGKISGAFSGKLLYNILLSMDMFSCKSASVIAVLSSDMKRSLIKRDQALENKIIIINNFDISSELAPIQKTNNDFIKLPNKQKIKLVFTGNIGKLQHLDLLVKTIADMPLLDNLDLVFVGEGAELERLKNLAKNATDKIHFIPHQPIEVVHSILQQADFGIISLQPGVIDYAYPSKTMTYMASGTPVLTLVDQKSELYDFVAKENIGVAIDPNELDKLQQFLLDINSTLPLFDREHIQTVYNKHYSKEVFKEKFIKLFYTVLKEKQ